MGQPSFLDNVREWIGSVAFNVFLWAFKMTADEYRAEIVEDARREYLSEKNSAWFIK